jgi:hypothetical protein
MYTECYYEGPKQQYAYRVTVAALAGNRRGFFWTFRSLTPYPILRYTHLSSHNNYYTGICTFVYDYITDSYKEVGIYWGPEPTNNAYFGTVLAMTPDARYLVAAAPVMSQ